MINTEKMVSVPRGTVENAAELLQEYNKCGIARDLRAILDKPAEQHQASKIADALEACEWRDTPIGNKEIILSAIQALRAERDQGEPVELPVHKPDISASFEGTDAEWYGNQGWNACLDEIDKLGPLYTRPAQGEAVAYLRQFDLQRLANPNVAGCAAVLEKTPCDGFVAIYTHADPGEVERLHSKIETMRRKNNEYCEEVERLSRKAAHADLALAAQTKQVHSLRAQLAERDALLRGYQSLMRQILPCLAMSTNSTAASYMRQIEAALSASAEPSAPKCEDCHGQGEVFVRKGAVHYGMQTEPEPIMAACPDCAEPSAPIQHPINMKTVMQAYEQVDHKALLHGTSNWCASMATALRDVINPEPIAPVERMAAIRAEAARLSESLKASACQKCMSKPCDCSIQSAPADAPKCRKCGDPCTHDDDGHDECRFCTAGVPSNPDDVGMARAALERKP